MLNLPISRNGFLWAFSIASQINRIPLATTLILQKYQAPFTLGSFRIAAEQSGFKIRQKAVPNSQLSGLPLPCLVTLIPIVDGIPAVDSMPMALNGNTALAQHAVREYQIALLEHIDEKFVVLAETCSKSTVTMAREAFEKRFAGEVLIIVPPATSADAPAKGKAAQMSKGRKNGGKFGMAGFLPQPGWLRSMFRSES